LIFLLIEPALDEDNEHVVERPTLAIGCGFRLLVDGRGHSQRHADL
jgi:hypothetical protein